MTRRLCAVLVLLFAGTMARAGDQRGWFVGAGLGHGVQELDVTTVDFSDTTTTWKAFAGYRVMKFIHVEADYVDFGKASDTLDLGAGSETIEIRTHGATLLLVGVLPLGKFFELDGKAGYLWWNSDLSGRTISYSNTGSDNAYGVGARVLIARKAGIRLDYERFDTKDTKQVTLTSVGFEWRF